MVLAQKHTGMMICRDLAGHFTSKPVLRRACEFLGPSVAAKRKVESSDDKHCAIFHLVEFLG